MRRMSSLLVMVSSFSVSTATTDRTTASCATGLAGWQRFLQSQPLGETSDLSELAMPASITSPPTSTQSIWRLLGQTLGGLSSNLTISLLAGTVAAGNLTLLAFDRLVTLPPEPDCTNGVSLDSARDQLTCWQTAIATGDTQARQVALAEVSRWPVSHPLFSEGQTLIERWSHMVLQEAQQAATGDGWATEIALVEQVSIHSPHFEAAQSLRSQLQTQQQDLAQGLNAQAQAALAVADWATAYQALSQLQQLDHAAAPLELPQQLTQQIIAEREATRLWNEAQRLWNSRMVVDRDAAIAIAHQIDVNTHRWQAIQPVVSRWSAAQSTFVQTYATPDQSAGAIAPAQLIAHPPGVAVPVQQMEAAASLSSLTTVTTQPQLASPPCQPHFSSCIHTTSY
jgi:hypothetical protein